MCTLAATMQGPCSVCGAKAVNVAWVIAAIFFISRMPPQWMTSGWAIATASFCSTSAHCHLVMKRSPAATGMLIAFLTLTSASTLASGGMGSSIQ